MKIINKEVVNMKINKWYAKDKFLTVTKKDGKLIIENDSNQEGKLFALKLIKSKGKWLNISFNGKTLSGAGAILSLVNKKRYRIFDTFLGSKSSVAKNKVGHLIPVIIVKPNSKVLIDDVVIEKSEKKEITFNKFLGKKKYLLITPSYPSPDDYYACGFVHTRVKAYLEAGLDVEVAVIYKDNVSTFYEFEGVTVYKTDYNEMKNIIMAKSYDGIFVHFLDATYAKNLIDGYLNDTPVFLWNHGADILFKDYKEIYTEYFHDDYKLPDFLKEEYKKREKYFTELIKNKNIYWIFVSEWEKNRAEELLKVKFKNSKVIHNYINEKEFKYIKKDDEQRKNIFLVRKFDRTKKYAVDIAVSTILELSKRDFFNDLNFYICGDGEYFNKLVEPIKDFKNVNLVKTFLTHDQIYEYHKKCGIGLFPTRQDTQGVSALEAASSGLAVISSNLPVINEFFDKKLNTLCETENIKEYADTIERLYKDKKEFQSISKKMSDYTYKKCCFDETIKKEIEYIEENKLSLEKLVSVPKIIDKKALLTITIPSYNASKYLQKCLLSILKSKYLGKLEILVINDGSLDNTKEIGLYFEELLKNKTRKILTLVDKENGGHGSGINKGLELATGKYFRVVDSDDWLDTEELDKYLEKLQNEDTDEILTDYCEARTYADKLFPIETFKFMKELKTYKVDDVCCGPNGFRKWGPSLPTATYKTELLRKTDFKLPEHTFYVDMLYNAYSIISVNTIKKYKENIYRYYIGNEGQSVSRSGMIRNCKDHEDVIIKLMDLITNDKRITPEKREYMIHLLLLPMVRAQYNIYIDFMHSRKKFVGFEKRIKKYKDLLKYKEFNERRTRIYRKTGGILVPFHHSIHKVAEKIRPIIK